MQRYLKRTFSLLIAFALVFSLFVPQSFAAYFPKDNAKSDNASNIVLIYTGYYNPDNYDGEKMGDYNKDKFLPYVGYLDNNGVAQDYFFDTFLMLATSSPYGGSLHRYYDWVPNSTPGSLKDWQWAMDRMFEKGLQLDALNQAVEQVSSQLKDPDKQVKIYLTMPFPDSQSKDFGDFNGDGELKNLESLDTRKELIKWYIDTMTKRFEDQNYKHLKLSGFYWLQEDLDTGVPGEKESVQYTAEYLNQKQLRLGWIPWSGAGEKGNGNKLGFDFSLIQPNHFFEEQSTYKRIEETADLAFNSDAGVEMEFDGRAIDYPHYRQVLYNYLIGGVKKQFMNDSILAYYQDVYAIYDMYHHQSPFANQMYRDIYKFSKGTYEAPKGNFEGRVVDESGSPIAGAQLKDEAGNLLYTNANGEFEANGLFATQHEFVVEKSEFVSRTVKVDIQIDQTLHQDVVLLKSDAGKLKDTYSLSNFEGGMVYGTNNGEYTKRTMVTDPAFVKEGKQSLRIDFKGYANNWVRAYVDSDFPEFQDPEHYQAYTQKDWSQYDSVSMAVYNPTDTTQTFSLEFLDQYSWGAAYTKKFELAPKEWTIVEQSIPEMIQAKKDVTNMIRISLLRYDETQDLTLYFDDVRLNKYEQVQETVLDNFEGNMKYGTNNGDYVKRSIVTGPAIVAEGTQSLKVDFSAYADGWVGMYIDSDFDEFEDTEHYPSYTLKDWSPYDTVSMAVYNPSETEQKLRFVYMHEYSWGKSVSKNVTLPPEKWTVVEHPLSELEQDGLKIDNIIRVAVMRDNETQNATFYFDDLKILKHENMKVAPDYAVSFPSKVPTMDLGAIWKPVVVNRAVKDAEGNPVIADAQFTSSDPKVIEVQPDGTLKAIASGKVVIRANVGNIEALSAVLEVSPWKINNLKGGKSALTIGKTVKLTLINSFENGYLIPSDEAAYKWEIIGDVIEKSSENQNSFTVKGVKDGKATVKVTITYNSKSQEFERIIQVGNSEPVDVPTNGNGGGAQPAADKLDEINAKITAIAALGSLPEDKAKDVINLIQDAVREYDKTSDPTLKLEKVLNIIKKSAQAMKATDLKGQLKEDAVKALENASSDIMNKVSTVPVVAESKDGVTKSNISAADANRIISRIDTMVKTIEELKSALDGVKSKLKLESVLFLNAKTDNKAGNAQIEIPASILNAAGKKNIESIKISTSVAQINLKTDAVTAKDSSTVLVTTNKLDENSLDEKTKAIVGKNPVYEFNVSVDGNKVAKFNKQVEVKIPYTAEAGSDTRKVTVFYLSDDGKLKNVVGMYSKATNAVLFKTEHFSKYFIKNNNVTFEDIDSVKWANDYIEVLASKGVVSGTGVGKFSPDANIKRAEFLCMLVRALNLYDSNATAEFSDVKPADWFYSDVASAVKAHIIDEQAQGEFSPNDFITREDMAVMIAKAIENCSALSAEKAKKFEVKQFNDSNKISESAKHSVELVSGYSIINGMPGNVFGPDKLATRAQAAVVIYKLIME